MPGHDAHHIISQKYRGLMMREFNINVDHPALMAWWERKSHSANWKKYNDEWEEFLFEDGKLREMNPEDVILKAIEMAEEWGKKKGHFEYYIKRYYAVPHSAGNYNPN